MKKHCDAVRASFSHRSDAVLVPLMTLLTGVVLPPFRCCFWHHWWCCRRFSSDAIMASFPLQRRHFRRSKRTLFRCHFGTGRCARRCWNDDGSRNTIFKCHFTPVLGTPSTSHGVVPFWGCRRCASVDNVGWLLRRRFGAVDDAIPCGATVNNNNNNNNKH